MFLIGVAVTAAATAGAFPIEILVLLFVLFAVPLDRIDGSVASNRPLFSNLLLQLEFDVSSVAYDRPMIVGLMALCNCCCGHAVALAARAISNVSAAAVTVIIGTFIVERSFSSVSFDLIIFSIGECADAGFVTFNAIGCLAGDGGVDIVRVIIGL